MIQNNTNKNEQARNAVEWDIKPKHDGSVVAVMNLESGDVLHIFFTTTNTSQPHRTKSGELCNGRAVVWDLLDSYYPSKRAAIRAAKMILIGQHRA
jgi:hypothetical protein